MRLSPLSPSIVMKILKKLGFQALRQKGSHMFFKHSDGRTTVVPFHKGEDISKGLLRKILRDIDVDWKTFISHK